MLSDWIELCRLFNDHHVEYLLVGGQAVIAIPLIDINDLIANKLAVGRLHDLADVEALQAARLR